MQVERFPFPSPPASGALGTAASALVAIGALHPDAPQQQAALAAEAAPAAQQAAAALPGGLTLLGQAVAQLPLSPRHACMLLQVGLPFTNVVFVAECVVALSMCRIRQYVVSACCEWCRCVQLAIRKPARRIMVQTAGSHAEMLSCTFSLHPCKACAQVLRAKGKQARAAAPYACALAAALSVETPFAAGDGSTVRTLLLHSIYDSASFSLRLRDLLESRANCSDFLTLPELKVQRCRTCASRHDSPDYSVEGEVLAQSKEARAAQAQLRDASSDSLSCLRALLAYLAAPHKPRFCRQALKFLCVTCRAAAVHVCPAFASIYLLRLLAILWCTIRPELEPCAHAGSTCCTSAT